VETAVAALPGLTIEEINERVGRLSLRERIIGGVLCRHIGEDGVVRLSRREIGYLSGLKGEPPIQVSRLLSGLAREGLITIETFRVGKGSYNLITVDPQLPAVLGSVYAYHGLDPVDGLVYESISPTHFADQRNWPKMEERAEHAGVTLQMFRKSIKKLVGLGYLEEKRGPHPYPRDYFRTHVRPRKMM